MPVQVSYPGVYIQESTSTVHTITPVATSVTAFVGRARRGPVSTPTTITSWPDFQRQFGDFWPVQSRLAYSVYDFFTNGGSSAVIVRLFHYPSSSTTPPAECATAVLTPEGSPTEVTLYATSPGSWGGALTATVDYNTAPGSAADVFNLTIIDGNQPAWAPQKYFNVTLNQAEPTPATGVPQPTYLLTALQADPTALVNMEPVASGSTTPTAPTATNPNASTPVPPISFTAPSTPDGGALVSGDFLQPQASKTGLYALENTDLFNLLVIPPLHRRRPVRQSAGCRPCGHHERRRILRNAQRISADRRAHVVAGVWQHRHDSQRPGIRPGERTGYEQRVCLARNLSDQQLSEADDTPRRRRAAPIWLTRSLLGRGPRQLAVGGWLPCARTDSKGPHRVRDCDFRQRLSGSAEVTSDRDPRHCQQAHRISPPRSGKTMIPKPLSASRPSRSTGGRVCVVRSSRSPRACDSFLLALVTGVGYSPVPGLGATHGAVRPCWATKR